VDRLRQDAVAALTAVSALLAPAETVRGGQPPVAGALVTTVQVWRAAGLAATLRECRGRGPRDWTRRTIVVDRRYGFRRSLTYRTLDRRSLASCDSVGVPIEGRRWCGAATGTLYGGRLRDPRLVLCAPPSARSVAFIWVTPVRRAAWIGVAAGGRTELYRVAVGLPVRVSTDRNVRIRGSTATFVIRQYGTNGEVIRRRRIVARVAG
jgi:hypothetical protein